MICNACGTENEVEHVHCTNCGTKLIEDQESRPSNESGDAKSPSVPKGCLILVLAIFTLPMNTARMAIAELRKIAKAGALEIDKDFPHLFWCKSMLPIIATVLSSLVFLVVIGLATASAGLGGFFVGLVVGIIAAALTDWFVMIVGEYMVIKVVSGRYYTQKIAAHEADN